MQRNKVILVTGANSGIGKATARQLAERGAHVVMVCRNRERGEPARQDIIEATGSGTVDLLTADFESQEQVRDLAADVKRGYDRLDVLINNAGLYLPTRGETEDGIEVTWAVNHLAPFLLTHLLLDRLKASAPARIVNVSSNSHYGSRIHFDDPGLREGYSLQKAYGQSKLANVLFTYELARRLAGTGVTANALHPGVVATRIWNRSWDPISLIMRPLKLFLTSPEKSARAVVRLAVDPDVEGVSGKYFDQMQEKRSSRVSYDEAAARRLWDLSERMTGLDD